MGRWRGSKVREEQIEERGKRKVLGHFGFHQPIKKGGLTSHLEVFIDSGWMHTEYLTALKLWKVLKAVGKRISASDLVYSHPQRTTLV